MLGVEFRDKTKTTKDIIDEINKSVRIAKKGRRKELGGRLSLAHLAFELAELWSMVRGPRSLFLP